MSPETGRLLAIAALIRMGKTAGAVSEALALADAGDLDAALDRLSISNPAERAMFGAVIKPMSPEREENTMNDTATLTEAPEVPAVADPVLLRAAAIVRERGWYPGGRYNGGFCAIQATYEATRPNPDAQGNSAVSCAAAARLARSLGLDPDDPLAVADWNDYPGRSAEEVAEALERAAYGL